MTRVDKRLLEEEPVYGPSSAVADRVAVFDGTTGKLIKDGGKLISEIGAGDVVGPSSSVDNRVAVFDGVTGKLIKDGGVLIQDLSGIVNNVSELMLAVSQIAMQVADNTNGALFLGATGNWFADSFDTLTYVDVAGSNNLNTGTAGVLKPTTTAGTNQIPAMTAATTSGVTMSASSTLASPSGFEAWRAGDRINSTSWHSANSAGLPQTLIVDFGTPKQIASYSLLARDVAGSNAQAPTAWTFEGYNGSAWISIDARSGNSLSFTTPTSFTISSPGNYSSYRLVMTSGGDAGNTSLAEIAMISVDLANNLTVRSAAFPAASVPTKIKALLRVREVDTAVAGIDYTLECSRDNGTTWTIMALTELFISPSPVTGIQIVQAAETSVVGQPSGSSVRWRFKTLNNKNIEFHDISFNWQ